MSIRLTVQGLGVHEVPNRRIERAPFKAQFLGTPDRPKDFVVVHDGEALGLISKHIVEGWVRERDGEG